MSYTKCPQCGLVNLSADEICERCRAPLSVNDTNAPAGNRRRQTSLASPSDKMCRQVQGQ